MKLSGITSESIVDGPGIRFVLFTQGCPHKCYQCHNPGSWDLNGGNEISVKQIIRTMRRQNKNIQGITFSGGEPFLQAFELAQLASAAHKIGWDVVTYTGYTYETLLKDSRECVHELLAQTDILIDGPYNHNLRDINLKFRGSSNQRVIDLKKTRKTKRVMLFCK